MKVPSHQVKFQSLPCLVEEVSNLIKSHPGRSISLIEGIRKVSVFTKINIVISLQEVAVFTNILKMFRMIFVC